jgi:hypothetical protein
MRKFAQYFLILIITFFLGITALIFCNCTPAKTQTNPSTPNSGQVTRPQKEIKIVGERPLSETENAYNPLPNPDGSLIAYIRTGWDRPGGSGGVGRSNLVSDVMVMDANGNVVTEQSIDDGFIYGWTSDGKSLICFRDGKYSIVSSEGKILKTGQMPKWSDSYDVSERVAFLPSNNSFLWLQNNYTNIKRAKTSEASEYMTKDFVRASIGNSENEFARFTSQLNVNGILVVSPDERYFALTGADSSRGDNSLWIYDRQNSTWTNLGKIVIHPNSEWDYIKPSWNPWFADSSRIVFATASSIVISTPDGKTKQVISKPNQTSGLAVPSPDGKFIAYSTFEPRPMKLRADLQFWGNSTIWIVSAIANSKARSVTKKNEDTTVSLHWLNDNQLVFDRIADEIFYKKARLWKVDVSDSRNERETK